MGSAHRIDVPADVFSAPPGLLEKWPFPRLLEAIDIVGAWRSTVGREYDWRDALNQQKYFYGILKNWGALNG
jgi:hypothetical protein